MECCEFPAGVSYSVRNSAGLSGIRTLNRGNCLIQTHCQTSCWSKTMINDNRAIEVQHYSPAAYGLLKVVGMGGVNQSFIPSRSFQVVNHMNTSSSNQRNGFMSPADAFPVLSRRFRTSNRGVSERNRQTSRAVLQTKIVVVAIMLVLLLIVLYLLSDLSSPPRQILAKETNLGFRGNPCLGFCCSDVNSPTGFRLTSW